MHQPQPLPVAIIRLQPPKAAEELLVPIQEPAQQRLRFRQIAAIPAAVILPYPLPLLVLRREAATIRREAVEAVLRQEAVIHRVEVVAVPRQEAVIRQVEVVAVAAAVVPHPVVVGEGKNLLILS